MYDLTQFVCPQLFVQFKYILKRHKTNEALVFLFSDNAQINDVLRYLENHQFQYSFKENQLTVSHFGKESF